MRTAIILLLWFSLSVVPSADAQEAPGSSPNVEFVKNIPEDAESAIGARLIGRHLYLTGTRALTIYDVADPLNPKVTGSGLLGYQFQNEDVSTNGRILLIAESPLAVGGPTSLLHVWDVSDPARPKEVGRLPTAGDHTQECILDCTFAYGSDGSIVDLRDPSLPKPAGNWREILGLPEGSHDVEEFRPGFVAVAMLSTPFLIVDVRDPLKPRIHATGGHPDPDDHILHSVRWPNQGEDRFVLVEGENGSGPFTTYRTDGGGYANTTKFELVDSFTLDTTSHWFEEHPRFRDGGLVAIAWYDRGTRFLEVAPDGKITEVGWYVAAGTSSPGLPGDAPTTWSVNWISDDIVYAIDRDRGIDILRYTGAIRGKLQPPGPGASAQPTEPRDPAAQPALTARISATRTRRPAVLRSGVGLRVSCSSACRGTLRLELPARESRRLGLGRRALTVGRRSFAVTSSPRLVRIRVSPPAARRIAKARSVSLVARAVVADRDGGQRRTLAARLVVRG